MSRVQKLLEFVSQRLSAAVEDILSACEKTLLKYEQEATLSQEVISRQHALLCALNKPLMDVPSADVFMQQLLVSNEAGLPEHQDQEDPHVRDEQEGGPLHLDEAEIIQFTYNARCAARPGQDGSLPAAVTTQTEPEPAGPDQEVQLVSSETEDSEDYSRDSADTRSASQEPKQLRPGGPARCLVCSRTFKDRRYLIRHLIAHLQEAEPVCGLCGEPFEAAETLKLHIQTHQRRRGLQTQTRSSERHFQPPDTNANRVQLSENTHTCRDCGKTFRQVWKKRRHRCQTGRKT
uniref:zinc finger protein 70-like n=1 Tax=Semicossyphus pulcher TaxID=241346 RepID=UPI0037E87D15